MVPMLLHSSGSAKRSGLRGLDRRGCSQRSRVLVWSGCTGWIIGFWVWILHGAPAAVGFSFSGPELFPIDDAISHLRGADLDGDGLQDLVLANNRRARITFLYNRSGQLPFMKVPEPSSAREVNELPPDARFEIRSLASEKRILALEVVDVNRDGRPDLVYYGEPRELVVHLNEGQRRWSSPRQWTVPDVPFSPHVLAAGDVDGDGSADLLLLGEYQIHRFRSTADGLLERVESLPLAQPAHSLQVLDIDGDGRLDLLLINWESSDPVRVRFQHAAGVWGPEIAFRFPLIRAYWADRPASTGPAYMTAIGQASGRAVLARFEETPGDTFGPFVAGQFEMFPIPRTEKARRGVVWADVDGDRRPDLLAADPDTGNLMVQRAGAEGRFASPARFPSLVGITEILAEDWDGDGATEVFLLSPEEKTVGICRMTDQGGLPFPRLLPVSGRPLAMALGKPQPAEGLTLAVLVDSDGQRLVHWFQAHGSTRKLALAPTWKGQLRQMLWHDADEDGLLDLVLLASYDRIKVLRQQSDGTFEELDVPPPGGTLENPWVAQADVSGDARPELLLGQRNLIRAIRLQKDGGLSEAAGWSFQAIEQINAPEREARLTAALTIPVSNAAPALCLLDAGNKRLLLMMRDAQGLWIARRQVPLPRADFVAMRFLPLEDALGPALAFWGGASAALMRLHGNVWKLRELDQYETPVRDGYLRDVTSGDVDHDGQKEWIFLETARHYVDIVRWRTERLEPGDRWPVFEERSYQALRTPRFEPREALVADVTGDGRNDLILLVHDRVLLYPQD